MGKEEINIKLKEFLELHNPFTEECQVVYFMCECRKILEHSKELRDKLHILWCYCNWVLHTSKSYSHDGWKEIFELLNSGIKKTGEKRYSISMRDSMSFFYGFPLKFELARLFKAQGFSNTYLNSKDWWKSFRILLFSVLRDQPIEDPIPGIAYIRYLEVSDTELKCSIKFKDERGKIDFPFPI